MPPRRTKRLESESDAEFSSSSSQSSQSSGSPSRSSDPSDEEIISDRTTPRLSPGRLTSRVTRASVALLGTPLETQATTSSASKQRAPIYPLDYSEIKESEILSTVIRLIGSERVGFEKELVGVKEELRIDSDLYRDEEQRVYQTAVVEAVITMLGSRGMAMFRLQWCRTPGWTHDKLIEHKEKLRHVAREVLKMISL